MKEGLVSFYPFEKDFLIASPNALFKWSQVNMIMTFDDFCSIGLDNDMSIRETLHSYHQIRTWGIANDLIFNTTKCICSIQKFICVGFQNDHLHAIFKGDFYNRIKINNVLLGDFCEALLKDEKKKQRESTEKVQRENDMMREHIKCMPNGPEFLDFMKHFDSTK